MSTSTPLSETPLFPSESLAISTSSSSSSSSFSPFPSRFSSSNTTSPPPSTFPYHPLTTAFSQNRGCDHVLTTTTVINIVTQRSSTNTYSRVVILSDAADPRYVTCQPPGYADANYTYSPGVCPAGWTAHEVVTRSDSTPLISGAYCCANGYTLSYGVARDLDSPDAPSPACASVISSEYTRPSTSPTVTPATGYKLHAPYRVLWRAADVSTLEPRPPDLASCTRAVRTWKPGDKTPLEECGRPQPTDGYNGVAGLWFCIVGLPVIAFLLICGCCGWCCYARTRERKVAGGRQVAGGARRGGNETARRAREEAEAEELAVLDGDGPARPPPAYGDTSTRIVPVGHEVAAADVDHAVPPPKYS